MFSTYNLSGHAAIRMAQRNVSHRDLTYVLEYGVRVYRTGITFHILRKRDIPYSDRNKPEITRLEGTVILTGFSQSGIMEIITMYRNKSAYKVLRCKAKYDNRKKYRTHQELS
jgi:hypothetical protein